MVPAPPQKPKSKYNKQTDKAKAIFKYLYQEYTGKDEEEMQEPIDSIPSPCIKGIDKMKSHLTDNRGDYGMAGRDNVTIAPFLPKRAAAAEDPGFIAKADDFIKGMSFNSPLVRGLGLGLIGGGLTYAFNDAIAKRLGVDQQYQDKDAGIIRYTNPKTRKWSSILTGLGLAGAYTALHYVPGYGLSSMLYDFPKKASMLGPNDVIPLGMAQQAIMGSDKLNMQMKYNAMNMLNSIPGDYNTPINSTDIVGAAINTGASARAGLPLGRLAVASIADGLTGYGIGNLIGVQNPTELGKTTGLLSAGLRLGATLFR